jgi:predicted  nucleic acid-binding Zn-ribbon protein
MLRYWQTASTALAKINDNISTALEGLDKEMDASMANSVADASYGYSIENSDEELEAFKKLLEDAQMQHVQLSKQLGSIIAAKDAEIALLKKTNNTNGSAADHLSQDHAIDGEETNETIMKLLQDKVLLEKSLEDYELRYQESLRAANDGKVLFSRFEKLSVKYMELETDHNELRSQYDILSKKTSEEIENLVSEYSKLAADGELRQVSDMQRIRDLSTDNEALKTKIESLEHIINDFADRALTNDSSTGRSGADISVGSSPSHAASELKELKVKLVNTQFDLKQRDDSILALREQVEELMASNASSSAVASANSARDDDLVANLEKRIADLMSEKSHLTADIDRLIVEKREAEDAGKSFYEQSKAYRKELDGIRQQLLDQASSANDGSASVQQELLNLRNQGDKLLADLAAVNAEYAAARSSASSNIAELTQERDALKNMIIALKQDLLTKDTTISSSSEQLQMLQRKQDALNDELTCLRGEYAKLESSRNQLEEQLRSLESSSEAKDSMDALIKTKDSEHQRLMEQLKLQEKQLATQQLADMKSQHDQQIDSLTHECADLKSSLQRLSSDRSNEASAYEAEISKLKQAIVELQGQVAGEKESSLKALREKHEEMLTAMERWKQDMTAALQQQEETLVRRHQDDRAAAIESSECEATERLARSLADLRDEHRIQLQRSITDLSTTLTQEKESALERAKEIAKQELMGKVSELESHAAAALEDLRSKMQAIIDDFQITTEKAKQDLVNVESRYEIKLKDALRALEVRKDEERNQMLENLKKSMQKIVDDAMQEKEEYLALYTKENKLRKSIHNKLLEYQGNIRVICRVRPVLDVERRAGEDVDVTSYPTPEDIVITRDPSGSKSRYEYDRVFAPGASQEDVFAAVQPLIVSVLDGYNICVFAYGQTGSGKRYALYQHQGVALSNLYNML